MEEEKVLDKDAWRDEAAAVIGDIKNHVKSIEISKKIKSTNQNIYLNLITFEDKTYCVEMTGSGFKIVGRIFDTNDISTGVYYETPYSMLNEISVAYQQSFANELVNKLNRLNDDKDEES